MAAFTVDVQTARLAPFLVLRDALMALMALQLRVFTEATWAMLDRLTGFDCLRGLCLTGLDATRAGVDTTATGAGLDAAGALETGVVDTGMVVTGVAATGVVLAGGVLVGVVVAGGVLVGGVLVVDPSHRPCAQHGLTTRSLLTGMSGPSMIQRFRGE